MKLMLICGAGMSSSLLANKVNDAIKKRELDIEAWAIATTEIQQHLGTFDVVLLAPQVRFYLDKYKEVLSNTAPIEVIPFQIYGSMNGDKIVDQAIELYNKTKNA